jgi:hypothetical protein
VTIPWVRFERLLAWFGLVLAVSCVAGVTLGFH